MRRSISVVWSLRSLKPLCEDFPHPYPSGQKLFSDGLIKTRVENPIKIRIKTCGVRSLVQADNQERENGVERGLCQIKSVDGIRSLMQK